MGVHKDVEVTPEQETLGVPGRHVKVLVGPSKLAAHRHALYTNVISAIEMNSLVE